ncbi:MAG TPA: aminoglycoside phosphotransferase family protein, partial [Chloroflexia bacterium]|nr:aminoglycoside phosphotransferase family protein [Chloroflexia bacterium]
MILVPEPFAAATVAREGKAGEQWIAALPHLVQGLGVQWGLVVDGPAMHGYLGLVVPVRRGDEPCVVKISWLNEATRDEVVALAAWNGRGAVWLLESEPEHGAMLLERLDWARSLNDVPVAEALAVAGGLLRRLAITAPAGMRTLPELAGQIARTLPDRWEQCGRPLPRRVLQQARGLASELGGACTARLLVNFDLHYADVLASRREPWLAVDPMVVAGDPEFGIAQLLWRRLEEIQAHGGLARHFDILTEAAA